VNQNWFKSHRAGRRSLKKWIEHCDNCRGAFPERFTTAKGQSSEASLSVTPEENCCGTFKRSSRRQTLKQPHCAWVPAQALSWKIPERGESIVRKKDCFRFTVRTQSTPRFAQYVGFRIGRKSKRLREAALRAKQQRSVDSLLSLALQNHQG
jgi:hypothetical protein